MYTPYASVPHDTLDRVDVLFGWGAWPLAGNLFLD